MLVCAERASVGLVAPDANAFGQSTISTEMAYKCEFPADFVEKWKKQVLIDNSMAIMEKNGV